VWFVRRSYALVLRLFAVWTVWVWGTRLWNIWRDRTRDFGFKAVHTVLAVVSVAFAVACWRIVTKVQANARAKSPAEAGTADAAPVIR
jgi:hypothetical protein